tara:strand:+ start:495 stop:728 length:234 start_codon:yes stop_codon:yes gene_type:complete
MGRALKKIMRKREKNANKKLSDKLGMFDKLGTTCQECGKRFDKRNKNMVKSWRVIVGGGEVDLYCPGCWRDMNYDNE